MVVTVSWIQSWAVIVISVSALCGAVVFLSCCVCWEYKRRNLKDLYIFKKTTMSDLQSKDVKCEKKIPKILSFSKYSKMVDNASPSSSNTTEKTYKGNELLDSTNSFNFDQVRLEIDIPDDQDDAGSCRSTDSRNTFYSVYPITRASSVAETMKSAFSQVDLTL